MEPRDCLRRFEELAVRIQGDAPPRVHVASRVMRRIRTTRPAADRTLAFLAAGSCVAALVVAVTGLWLLSELSDPLEALLEVMPPIGL